jgi:hypothetical protein
VMDGGKALLQAAAVNPTQKNFKKSMRDIGFAVCGSLKFTG